MTRCKNCNHPLKKGFTLNWEHSMSRSSGWSQSFTAEDCHHMFNKHTQCGCFEPVPKKKKKLLLLSDVDKKVK